MRVLHSGNVANNAYLNAKLQRRAGIAADALCDEWHIFSQPEWEDAPIDGSYGDYEPLMAAATAAGWSRPDWVLSPPGWIDDFASEGWVRERMNLAAELPSATRRWLSLRGLYEPLRPRLGSRLTIADVLRATAWRKRLDRAVGSLGGLFRDYDIVQANGTHPILCLLVDLERPWIAFEHGTLRDLPYEDSYLGRLLAAAYAQARAVVITNPDTLSSARRLGLGRVVFIPHPVDEDKYRPGRTTLRSELGVSPATFLVFAPASHNWEIKGNDAMIRAFAEFAQSNSRNTVLVVNEWGLDLDRSRKLIEELAIGRAVRWLPPMPKWKLIDAYRAADVVLDQFLIGTFGAVAPEAMACGTPVVLAFDAPVHEWCFAELPPVLAARTADEIRSHLDDLATAPQGAADLGAAGRAWVERHHGWRSVTGRYRLLYDELLGRGPTVTVSSEAAAHEPARAAAAFARVTHASGVSPS